jgi:hypothetical protein
MSSRSPFDGESGNRTHVTCLDCGEELPYDWHKMEIEGGAGIRGRGRSHWLRLRAAKAKRTDPLDRKTGE